MKENFFQGVPVASGTFSGRAQVIRDWKKDFPVDADTVLIVRFPLPKISPLLKHASALLCAYGSSDSYLANAARAQGIPAVFQLGESRNTVSDGEWLVVDGTTGKVIDAHDHRMAE